MDPHEHMLQIDSIRSSKRRNSVFENLPDAQLKLFNTLDRLEFDIFEYKKGWDENVLSGMMEFIFTKNDLFSNCDITVDPFMEFFHAIQDGYEENSYHNATHAADVV